MATKQRLAQALCAVAFVSLPFAGFCDDAAIQRELDLIKEQNRILQEQVRNLTDKVAVLEESKDASARTYDNSTKTNRNLLPAIKLGVQGGLGWQISNFNRKAPFFVDDVKLSLDARLAKHISFFSDVNLSAGGHFQNPVFTAGNTSVLSLNEIYLDFHNLLERWNRDQLLNVRVGQFYAPFGDNLENRYPFDNPLVAHSLPDIWALTPGLELYGKWNKLSYAVAAQNSDDATWDLGSPDKLVSGKIGYQITDSLDISASGLRTGDLQPGELSAVFFHDNTLVSGPPTYIGTVTYIDGGYYYTDIPVKGASHAEVGELDARYKWNSGYVKGWGGIIHGASHYSAGNVFAENYDDNFCYYGVEGLQDLTARFYVAGRAGQILNSPQSLRLTAGAGYRFNDHLVLKTDFTYDENSFWFPGYKRYTETLSGELAFRF